VAPGVFEDEELERSQEVDDFNNQGQQVSGLVRLRSKFPTVWHLGRPPAELEPASSPVNAAATRLADDARDRDTQAAAFWNCRSGQ
jgi:hypothetical protein